MAALFGLPYLGAMQAGFVVVLLLLIHGTAYSAFVVPYIAIGAEAGGDYYGQSEIMSYRVYGGSLGLLVAATFAPWLLALWGSDPAGHASMGAAIGLIIAAPGIAAVFLLPKGEDRGAASLSVPLATRLALAWSNKPFRLILLAHVSFQITVAAAVSSTAYFSRHVLMLSDAWLGIFYGVKVAGNLLPMPLWLRVSRRFDKKAAYIAALTAYGLFNLSWLFAGPGDPIALVILRMFLIGIAMGGVILLGYSVVNDVISYDFVSTGLRREGAFGGVISLVDKATAAVGIAFIGYLLSAIGYVSSTTGVGARQSASALSAIYLSFALIPGAAALLSMMVILGYSLRRSDLELS